MIVDIIEIMTRDGTSRLNRTLSEWNKKEKQRMNHIKEKIS